MHAQRARWVHGRYGVSMATLIPKSCPPHGMSSHQTHRATHHGYHYLWLRLPADGPVTHHAEAITTAPRPRLPPLACLRQCHASPASETIIRPKTCSERGHHAPQALLTACMKNRLAGRASLTECIAYELHRRPVNPPSLSSVPIECLSFTDYCTHTSCTWSQRSPGFYKAIPTPSHEPASSARHEPNASSPGLTFVLVLCLCRERGDAPRIVPVHGVSMATVTRACPHLA